MISGPCHPLVVGKKVVTRHSTLHWLDWLDRRKRECWCACVPLCTCICMYVCAHTCVLSGEASHALFVINFFPNSICKGEMEAVPLLLWHSYTEVLIIVVASCHIYPCGTDCIYPASMFHEYWGSNCSETQCILQMTYDWCVWRSGFIMYLQHSSTTRKLVFPSIALTEVKEGKQMCILNVSDLLLKQWINVLSCLFSTVFPQRQSTEITTSKLFCISFKT